MKRPEKSLPDTNTIIRYLTRDDESLYVRAKEFFDKIKNGTIKAIIMESVIAECIYILTKIYKVPKSTASEKLVDILHYKGIVNENQKELIHALTLFSERNIDIVDCILCIKAVPAEIHLFSFDDDLNKLNASLRHQTV